MRRHHRHTSPHALGNGMSDRLETCLAGLVESLRGWSVWPGTGPITTTTLESSTFYARRTRIVRRGFGGAELARRQDPFTAIRSADRERAMATVSEFFQIQKYATEQRFFVG